METANTRAGGLVLAAYGAAVTIGGANFLAVRFSNRELDPFWGAGLRFGLAAALFVIIVLSLQLPWPRGRQLLLTAVYGFLSFALFYALMYWALVQVTAGVATVVMAVVPLVTVLLATAQHLEILRWQALLGSLLALAGIVWMVMAAEDVVLPLTALLAMLAASLCAGQSVIVSKKLSGNHPAVTNAVGMMIGALALLGMSAFVGEVWTLPRLPEAVWSIVYLVSVGSVGLFVLVLLVVRHWTASATSYMFVLFPVVTMVLEAWLADEPVTVHGAIGAGLVMAGVWFGALSPAVRQADVPDSIERTSPPIFEPG
ncbi:MAG: DMT family transporter [Acidimicrobiia bacterium]